MKKMKRLPAASLKLGDNRHEPAVKHRKAVRNFSQSKDIREDRGMRQTKLGKGQGASGYSPKRNP